MSLVGAIFTSAALVGATSTAVLSGSTTVGNNLAVWGYIQSGTPGSGYTGFTLDDGGNTWSVRSVPQNAGRSTFAASAPITSGGIRTIVITGTGGAGGMFGRIAGGEFTGSSITGDQIGTGTAFGASPVNLNTGGANAASTDLVLAAIAIGGGTANSNILNPPTTGYSSAALNNNDSTDSSGELAWRLDTTTTTDTVQWTVGSLGTDGSAAGLWSFKFQTTAAGSSIPVFNYFQTLGVM